MKFDWDNRKNHSNLIKHKISFENAMHVFSDIGQLQFMMMTIQIMKTDGQPSEE